MNNPKRCMQVKSFWTTPPPPPKKIIDRKVPLVLTVAYISLLSAVYHLTTFRISGILF